MGKQLIDELSDADTAEIVALPHREVPATVAVVVQQVELRFPRYTMLHDAEHADFLSRTAARTLTGFLELLVDRDAPQEELMAFMRQVGAIEVEEGLTREISQAAFRTGAGVALKRLTEIAQGHPRVTPAIIGTVANAVFGYLNDLERAVSAGHADASARRVGDLRQQRGALIDLLLDPAADQEEVIRLARRVEWPLPRQVAAIALGRPSQTPRSVLTWTPTCWLHWTASSPAWSSPIRTAPGVTRCSNTGYVDGRRLSDRPRSFRSYAIPLTWRNVPSSTTMASGAQSRVKRRSRDLEDVGLL